MKEEPDVHDVLAQRHIRRRVVMNLERERRLHEAVERAVRAADEVILDASDGSVEETNYLTAKISEMFAEKACIAAMSEVHRKEFADEQAEKAT